MEGGEALGRRLASLGPTAVLLLVGGAALRPLLEAFARVRSSRGGEIAVITDRDEGEYAFVAALAPRGGARGPAPPTAYLVDHMGLPAEEEEGAEVHGSLGGATLLCLYRLEELATEGDMAAVADLLDDHPEVFAAVGPRVLGRQEVLRRLTDGYRAELAKFLGGSPEARELLATPVGTPGELADLVCRVRRLVGGAARALEREALHLLLA